MLPERRRLLIIALLVVLLGAVGWSYFGSGGTSSGPRAGGTRPATTPGRETEPLPVAESVRLAALARTREEPGASTRNPFTFERRVPVAAATPESAPVFRPAPPPESAVPAGPPPPPPIPLKFIGILEKGDGAKWAVLSVGEGRAPLHGKEGDIIDGRYRILKIGTESIDLVYLDGRGKQTIRLTGQ